MKNNEEGGIRALGIDPGLGTLGYGVVSQYGNALRCETYGVIKTPPDLSLAQRLAMLLAVLHRHAGLSCFDKDVFINAVGGVKIAEPASDLAVLLAVVSSMTDRPLPSGTVVFGEVGLAGEIRPAPRGQERLKEAAKLGFGFAVIPRANAPKTPIEGLKVAAVDRLTDAISAVRSKASAE